MQARRLPGHSLRYIQATPRLKKLYLGFRATLLRPPPSRISLPMLRWPQPALGICLPDLSRAYIQGSQPAATVAVDQRGRVSTQILRLDDEHRDAKTIETRNRFRRHDRLELPAMKRVHGAKELAEHRHGEGIERKPVRLDGPQLRMNVEGCATHGCSGTGTHEIVRRPATVVERDVGMK